MTTEDRICGCVFGGALGDALGAPHEGKRGPVAVDKEQLGAITDDTQLTLATCEAIAKTGTVDPAAIAERMADWFRERHLRGLGSATFKSLSELVQGGHWALVGLKGEKAVGNGAAMRIAPLAFLLDPTDANDRRTVRDVARITHHHEEAYMGALAVLAAVRFAWDGTWTGGPELIDRVIGVLPDCVVRDRLREMAGIDPATPALDVAKQFGNSGYVAESVPLAIYGAMQMADADFLTVLKDVVATGGDTDTIASMAGQIGGTLRGYQSLPHTLLQHLPESEMIREIADSFVRAVANHGHPRGTGRRPGGTA